MSKDKRLALVLAINLSLVAGLLGAGLLTHSLGVLASGADYLGDALGTGLSLTARRLNRRNDRPGAVLLAALANSALLLAVTLAVATDAIVRLIGGPPTLDAPPVIIVSVIAAGAMVGCAAILGNVEGDLSMQSVMLDSLADAAAALGVAVSAAVIWLTGGAEWLDPAVALAISVVVAHQAAKLMLEARAGLA